MSAVACSRAVEPDAGSKYAVASASMSPLPPDVAAKVAALESPDVYKPMEPATPFPREMPLKNMRVTACHSNVECGTSFPEEEFAVTTHYVELRGKVYLTIWGGAMGNNPRRGGILIQASRGQLSVSPSGTYGAPAAVGSLVLRDVEGNTVSFTYRGGSGTFDLDKTSWSIDGP